MEKYLPSEIEKKWQGIWAEQSVLSEAVENSDKQKFYCLDMFPYPSGAGLHVGHVENYTATDIYSRFKRMNNFNVLHPIGWDAFGLPAENFAIKNGTHPNATTHQNIQNFIKQIKSLGISYDWSREIDTSSPEYYKWTQWFFLFLYKNGLAYKKKAKVNWCDSCMTVLANEQVVDGACERCQNQVVQKDLEQWFFKITDFIEDQEGENGKVLGLINGLDDIDWPSSTKIAQKNWIGKSEGVEFDFEVKNSDKKIKVFTTRIDTAFGVTYVVVSPEHAIVSELKSQISNFEKVEKYQKESKKKTDLERMETKDKTGVRLEGVEVVNPFNGESVPLFIGDYVLSQYGTGAVMAVPAHDERDYDFAKKYDLPIIEVVSGGSIENGAFTDDGVLVNSGDYSNLSSVEAREKIAAWLEEKGIGKLRINYKLRDWLVSRQRYWGAPIPIIYCDKCGEVPEKEENLPVMLPTDVDFKPTGESPLVYSKTFHDVNCPKCGSKARRESDTMDTFVCSSWYYLRFADPKNEKKFASKESIEKWMPVDLYMGGAEHTVLHLLYARFFTKALKKFGYVNFDEPFLKLRHQGMIMAEDGRKMSKSLGNVVNPDDVTAELGADALRLYEMFMGPLEEMKAWNTQNIIGLKRFLDKVWKIQEKIVIEKSNVDKKFSSLMHKTIKKVAEDIENFRFNTAISAMMILVNEIEKQEKISIDDYKVLVTILSPFAPHVCEEIWSVLGNKESVFLSRWPQFNPVFLEGDEIEMIIQVNGKLRDKLTVAVDVTEDEIKETALESEKIKVFTEGKEIKKIIFVPGKLINIVVV
jgi:leucyl-tRNA synthetase